MKDFAQLTIPTPEGPSARDDSSSSAPLTRSMTASSKRALVGDPAIRPRQSPVETVTPVNPRPCRQGY